MRTILGILIASCLLPTTAWAKQLKVSAIDSEPRQVKAPTPENISALRKQVKESPKSRQHRFSLVLALTRAKRFEEALTEAKKWRTHDAYNLVVVRLIGDILSELKQTKQAVRAYSAVVELLPEDVRAHRALATVMKQAGRFAAAQTRLEVAVRLKPSDPRLRFELADTLLRQGKDARALALLQAIAADDKTPKKIAYPAKQRLAQLLAKQRTAAKRTGNKQKVSQLTQQIAALNVKGGVENDIKIYLTWDSDRTDVDLWVTTPTGEKIYYSHKKGKHGGALFDDVTDGYGPESFTAKSAQAGTYAVTVHYYGTSRRKLTEARGEVVIIVGEGSTRERRHVLPYKLYSPKQTVTVAKIRVR